ncbi:hypothetical protein PLESTB_001212300 [Pleodorina starrii]|uniref:Uncharacterized protein n=1 Tax=Pleodorina starrii TaxID=330485 RepID=A0A9W6F5L1_9CHLO|nr:hypothetical protein PLESTM_001646800 [Pleodorina starrii]GLC57327.1 hypothetical protein PLESTB_001212300 [Pleodorina starrii]GLC71273.1 hypothetical protein PLESTF_001097600 [Pleodorina starrii]
MVGRCHGRELLQRAATLLVQQLQAAQYGGSARAAAAASASRGPHPHAHPHPQQPWQQQQQQQRHARAFSSTPVWSSSSCPSGPPAFAFDIDGVLIRGKHVLPEALEAVRKLTHPDGHWRYPVVFMTNGGGVCEARKAQQLSEWLGVRVEADQVILSHTPMRDLVPELAQRPVLVSGRGDVLNVARSYGLQRVLHTRQLGRAMPAATPFSTYPPEEQDAATGGSASSTAAAPPPSAAAPSLAAVGPHPSSAGASSTGIPGSELGSRSGSGSESGSGRFCPVRDLGLATEAAPIDTVLVMTDPDDWYRDAQLICDVLTGAGVATRSAGAAAASGAPPVKLVFSNPDLLWANEFPKNRFGQGAFAHMTLSLFARLTGGARPHHVTFYGKPNPQPYRLAERLLLAQARRLGLTPPQVAPESGSESGSRSGSGSAVLPFSGIFAVGDNPAADVRGANQAGPPWVSVLVRTGVFQGPGPNCDVDTARVAVDDVAAAVEAAMHHSRRLRWHSMR